MISDDYKEAVLAPYTNRIPLVLMELTNDNWPEPLRIVGNTESITSGGHVYEATGMTFKPVGTGSASSTLVIEDVTRKVVEYFRGYIGDVSVTASVILAHDPDTVELGPWDFTIQDVGIQGIRTTCTLSKNSILRNSLKGASVDANMFPGLYI